MEPLNQALLGILLEETEAEGIIQTLGRIGDERAVIPLFKYFLNEGNFEEYSTHTEGANFHIIEAFKKIGKPAPIMLNAIIKDLRRKGEDIHSTYRAAVKALEWIQEG